MRVEITPAPLRGTVQAIASKSHAHRLLIASALSGSRGTVGISTTSEDIEATKACLEQLNNETPFLDCGESGSTLRFLLPVTMALKEEAVFAGSGRLPVRPLSPLKDEMEAHGCRFINESQTADGPAPICRVKGQLRSGDYSLPGNISSQYITGLLFALPLTDGESTLEITTLLESAKYVDMTLDVLRQAGIVIHCEDNNGNILYRIPGGQKYDLPDNTSAEGDWSNIAFWIIAGILAGGDITCTGLDPDSLQGDKAVAEIAEAMGGNVTRSGNDIRCAGGSLTATEIDASGIPDLVPVLSVAAAAAKGTTRIYNAGRLRIKESDRLSAVCDCLSRLGADITEEPEGLVINGTGTLKGGTVSGYNDHRIVMAMAVASIISEAPVIIEGAEAINKSYPSFFEDFEALGGNVRVL